MKIKNRPIKEKSATVLQKILMKPANTVIKNRFSQGSAKAAACCMHM